MTTISEQKIHQVLIVDDHPVMRGGLASLLEPEDDIVVAGEAGTVREAMRMMAEIKPDLVLADLRLPDGNGLEMIKDALAQWPDICFLVVSMHDEKIFAERVLRAGARGYVMKEAASEHLLQGVRSVLSGDIHVSDDVAKIFVDHVSKHRRPASEADSPLKSLTDRELEVFEQVGLGLRTRQIAERLSISVKTVESHFANIKSKLNLEDRNQLTRYAVRWIAEQA